MYSYRKRAHIYTKTQNGIRHIRADRICSISAPRISASWNSTSGPNSITVFSVRLTIILSLRVSANAYTLYTRFRILKCARRNEIIPFTRPGTHKIQLVYLRESHNFGMALMPRIRVSYCIGCVFGFFFGCVFYLCIFCWMCFGWGYWF